MIFIERIEKLLATNHLKEVIDEFLKFLNEVPQSATDAKADARQLRGQVIVLSGRFTDLNTKINTNTIDSGAANQERSSLINSFIQILDQMPSTYPDLNIYMEEKNEDDEWKESQKQNTIEAYQAYFSKYPNGKYKADPIKLITELEEVKNRQDSEIKRLALLEKERRENDKTSGDLRKTSPTALGAATPPARRRKGLFIGLGVILLVIIIFFMIGNDSTKKTDVPAVTASPNVDSNSIDISNYYFLENRENGKILAVQNNIETADAKLVVTTPEDKEQKDFEKFRLEPSTGKNQFYICTKKNDMVVEIENSGEYSQSKKSSEQPQFQIFIFTKNEEGYFTILTKIRDVFMGLDPETIKDDDGQKIKSTTDNASHAAQWKLIPTGEKCTASGG